MRKFFGLALVILLNLTVLGGCIGISDLGENSVVIIKAYSGTAGTEDKMVEEELEKRYKQDTGKEIDIIMEWYAHTDFYTKASQALADNNTRGDFFMDTYTENGLISTIINEQAKDLTNIIDQYGSNIKELYSSKNDPGGIAYRNGTMDGKLYSLSSVMTGEESRFGILVRKDHMKQTSFNPDEYDATKSGYKNMTVKDFGAMLEQIKSNVMGVTRPLVGNPWDLDRIIAPAFGAVTYEDWVYRKVGEKGEKFYPAYITEEYQKFMNYLRTYITEKNLFVENASSLSQLDLEQHFGAGKGSVFINAPEGKNLIRVANQTKAANPEAEFILMGSLKEDEHTEARGFVKTKRGLGGLLAPYNGINTEQFIQFLNWLYSSKDNYELAKYGIKGRHWEAVEIDGVDNGWKFPNNKKEEYTKKMPYSGMYDFITVIPLSNRIYAGGTETETRWTQLTYQEFPHFPLKYDDEGILLKRIPTTERATLLSGSNINRDFVINIRDKAWVNTAYPISGGERYTIDKAYDDLRINAFTNQNKRFVEYKTNQFKKIKSA